MLIISKVVPYTSTCATCSADLPILEMNGPTVPFTNMPIIKDVLPYTSTCATRSTDLPILAMYGTTDPPVQICPLLVV